MVQPTLPQLVFALMLLIGLVIFLVQRQRDQNALGRSRGKMPITQAKKTVTPGSGESNFRFLGMDFDLSELGIVKKSDEKNTGEMMKKEFSMKRLPAIFTIIWIVLAILLGLLNNLR